MPKSYTQPSSESRTHEGNNGRAPIGLERMLRMYFVQHWFNLADEACEEALLDSTALRRFVGIDLGCDACLTAPHS